MGVFAMPRADQKTIENLVESAAIIIRMVEKRFKIHLDFSEESLVIADDLITLFFKERKSHYYRAAGIIGSYLGAVIIQNLGGRWESDFSLKKVGSLKGCAYPMHRANKRLTNGLGDSLVSYYRSLKLSTCQETGFAPKQEKIAAARVELRAQGWDVKLLMRMINESEKKYVREESADLLGRIGDSQMVEPLINTLRNPKTAYYAAVALQGIPDARAFEPLMEVLRKTRSPAVKMQVALALGALKDNRATETLVQLLSDPNEIVCHYASIALGSIGGEKTLEALLEIMAAQRPGNRVYAIAALEGIRDKRVVPALIEALFSRDEEVREAAARALQYVPDERAFRPLVFMLKDKSSRIRTLAAYAMANFGDSRALPYIKMLLKDEVQSVRQHAAQLLHWLEAGKAPPRCA